MLQRRNTMIPKERNGAKTVAFGDILVGGGRCGVRHIRMGPIRQRHLDRLGEGRDGGHHPWSFP